MAKAPRQFRCLWPIKSGSMHAKWQAVSPLLRGLDLPTEFPMSRARFTSGVWMIHRLWRARVRACVAANCLVPSGVADSTLLRCPPTFSRNQEHCRVCNRRLICPWCWCRHLVHGTYSRVDAAAYARTRVRAIPMDLLGIQTSSDFPADDLDDVLHDVRLRSQEYRKHLNRFALGGHYNATIEPHTRELVRVRDRILLVLPPEDARDLELAELFDGVQYTTTRRSCPLNREKLSYVVGWVTAYPTAMLTGDLALASAIYAARQGSKLRLLANTGILRDSVYRRFLNAGAQYKRGGS